MRGGAFVRPAPSKSSTTRCSQMSERLAADDRGGAFDAPGEVSTSISLSDGAGCHAGADRMRAAAQVAGKSEVLARYAEDYPKGPHDEPQSMCPAFGSLRVGLRMRRTATVLSGSACCVMGSPSPRIFTAPGERSAMCRSIRKPWSRASCSKTSARRSMNWPNPALYDTVIVTNLCVPTASGVPLQLVPRKSTAFASSASMSPGFGVPTHAEAKDVLAGAMLKYARTEAENGPVAAPRERADRPTITLLGEMFPADPVGIGMMLEPWAGSRSGCADAGMA